MIFEVASVVFCLFSPCRKRILLFQSSYVESCYLCTIGLKFKKKLYIYIYKFSWSCGASQVDQWQRIHLLAGDRHVGPIPGSGGCPGVEDGHLPGKSHGHSMRSVVYGVTKSRTWPRDWIHTHTVLCLDNSQMDDSCLALLMSCGCGQMVANIQISQSPKSTDLKLFQNYFYFGYQLKHRGILSPPSTDAWLLTPSSSTALLWKV